MVTKELNKGLFEPNYKVGQSVEVNGHSYEIVKVSHHRCIIKRDRTTLRGYWLDSKDVLSYHLKSLHLKVWGLFVARRWLFKKLLAKMS